MKTAGRKRESEAKKDLPESKPRHGSPVITVDYELYAHFLEHAELSDEQKREFLQTLWNIIVELVSMGFGVHPVQQAQNSCGQLSENSMNPPPVKPDGVLLNKEILTENFASAAGLETGTGAERFDE